MTGANPQDQLKHTRPRESRDPREEGKEVQGGSGTATTSPTMADIMLENKRLEKKVSKPYRRMLEDSRLVNQKKVNKS